MNCFGCGTEISYNEAGLYRKLVNRGASECLCLSCLAKEFRTTQEKLRVMIEEYKKYGCTLFS